MKPHRTAMFLKRCKIACQCSPIACGLVTRFRLLSDYFGLCFIVCLSGDTLGEVAGSTLINEAWFLAVLIVVIGAVVWSVLCLFSVWIYRRHRAGKKIPKNRARPGQSVKGKYKLCKQHGLKLKYIINKLKWR